jgi:hypothetical protein
MASIVNIDGRIYSGDQIVVKGNRIFVDGIEQDGVLIKGPALEVRILEGVLQNLQCDGSVVAGNIAGNVNAGGSVECHDIVGNVSAGGSVRMNVAQGRVTAGGSVRIGG